MAHHHVARESYSPAFSSIIVDGNSGAVLSSNNPDGIRRPASLTKIMTLYLLFERLDAGKMKLDTEMEVSEHASDQAPTKLGVRAGEAVRRNPALGEVRIRELTEWAEAGKIRPNISHRLPLEDFAKAFDQSDLLFLTEIYAAGEQPIPGVSGARLADIVREAGHPSVTFVEQKDTLVDQVLPHLKSGDLVITLGAGDIWKTGLGLLARLTPTA